ncbi:MULTISPECIES: aldo/keto reductase [unclassified Streptomyces]|uniref:aldo/keto reductase n=1 Tax=unclassified Streptomyces TaxID=2593676 RepID=UPI002E8083D5|nr:aldo/keto reductase [Streptomyces sp. NBC_00589]WTI36167.1 aldo/keto reductase [Streptomyces sp. NBC_00775]WUB30158.1 aldo/keto reductase [Streptomyces sp. NBC_00589]
MRYRLLGDLRVGAIGLGAMPLSIEGHPDEARALATVHAALDAGVTLLDTADSYHLPGAEPGHNEQLVARALATYGGDTSEVLVATKGGRGRPSPSALRAWGDPHGSWTVTGSPAHLKSAAEASLKRLGVEAIGLYQLHKPDPAVPFEDSVGALRELLDAGKIRLAGISNTTTDQIRRAHAILGDRLVSVQNQYSPEVRDSEPELRLCAELGIAFLPWSPLGGISRSSLRGSSSVRPDDRFGAFHEVAHERGVSPQQICLAWLLTRSPNVIPIPGASRPETIRDSAGAADLVLDTEELARLDAGAGPRD